MLTNLFLTFVLAIPSTPAQCAHSLDSINEWGRLHEVVVGRVEGAVFPDEPEAMIKATMPKAMWRTHIENAGKAFPQHQIDAAARELNEFARVLEAEGVRVRRPENAGSLFHKPIQGEGWNTKGGLYVAMPRDNLLMVGNKLIEAPMSWRSRQNESIPYEKLFQEFQDRGVDRITAPKPRLSEAHYTAGWDYIEDGQFRSVITNDEPTFDAADFMRFGQDIVGQESHVTNKKGIEWLQKTLGPDFRIHTIQFRDDHPMHIDATIVPLRPGLVIVNPERVPPELVTELKSGLFKGWDFRYVPRPVIPDEHTLYMTSKWINMNILSLDEERVVIESQDEPMKRFIESFGLKAIPVPFRNFNSFGGSFHCATLDVARDADKTVLNRGD